MCDYRFQITGIGSTFFYKCMLFTDHEDLGRVVIELDWDAMPKTCENFRARCTGEQGPEYHYKGRAFNMIMPGIAFQGKLGVASIRGLQSADELSTLKHSEEGVCLHHGFRGGGFQLPVMYGECVERPSDRAVGGSTVCEGVDGCD